MAATEDAFRAMAAGRVVMPPIQTARAAATGNELEVKSAVNEASGRAASKVITWAPTNPAQRGLPSLLGLVLLFDAENGQPLSIMDATAFTGARTAVAGALGARYLARADSTRAAIIGTGAQGRWQLRVLSGVFPLREASAYSIDLAGTERYAEEMSAELRFPVHAVSSAEEAVAGADIAVTATDARSPILRDVWIRPGMHITAIGADGPGKQELDPQIFRRAYAVVDYWPQARVFGEAQHGLRAGILSDADPPPELGAVIAGARRGRSAAAEITLFDSTGTGLQDVAAADVIYRRAVEAGLGAWISL
jgi:alanine dehydrogenase